MFFGPFNRVTRKVFSMMISFLISGCIPFPPATESLFMLPKKHSCTPDDDASQSSTPRPL